MKRSRFSVCVPLLMATVCLAGQVGPGQGYPGGQYPPGRYPPGGQYPNGRNPGQGASIPRPGGRKSKSQKPDVTTPDFFADAEIVSVDGKQLVANTDDGRTLTLSVIPQTIWQVDGKASTLASMKPEMGIHIEAAENDESFLTALTINVTAERVLRKRPPADESPDQTPVKPGDSQTQAGAADNSNPPNPTSLGAPPDDPDRPRLTRGKPKVSASSSSASDDDAPAAAAPSRKSAAKSAEAPSVKKASTSADGTVDFTIDAKPEPKRLAAGVPTLIAQTMDWVGNFSNGLPNYICQQLTTRYVEFSKDDGWQPQDVISAKMLYEDGKEKYGDITVGGKRTNKGMLDLGGSTSTGEYAATLRALFWPGTKTQFHFAKSSTVETTVVSVYNYTVDLDHSNWTIKVGGQVWRPGYSGEVWVNKATGEVRKIEMQADNVPKNFPMRSIFSSVAYDPVRLGTSSFLLPVVAVNQTCERKSSTCSKNDVEWRNYQKFSGESTIVYK